MKKLILILAIVIFMSCSTEDAPVKNNCFQITKKVMKARYEDNNVLTYWLDETKVTAEEYSAYKVGDEFCPKTTPSY